MGSTDTFRKGTYRVEVDYDDGDQFTNARLYRKNQLLSTTADIRTLKTWFTATEGAERDSAPGRIREREGEN